VLSSQFHDYRNIVEVGSATVLDVFTAHREEVMSNHRSRVAATLAALALTGGALAVLQTVTAAPAAAVPGLVRVTAEMTPSDSASPKVRSAICPTGMKVLGGGAHVVGPAAGVIRLTQLKPVSPGNGQNDRYDIAAEEPFGGVAGKWSVEGYALCAPAGSVPGHEVVREDSASNSVSVKETAAPCPTGKRVIGTGAEVVFGNFGAVGLTLSRASGPLDIARAAAAEDGVGHPGNWYVSSYAVCAKPVGATVHGSLVTGAPNTIQECPAGKLVHSVGGGTGPAAGGAPTFLSELYPSQDRFATVVRATGVPAAGLVAQAVCD
jgi:hypothetical protein